jgi:hypothetical protein
MFQVSRFKFQVMALALCAAVLSAQTACSPNSVVKMAERVGSSARAARPVVQSLIDQGVIGGGGAQILSRLTQISADSSTLADAFRGNDLTGAVNITARTIQTLETLIGQDAQLIPAKHRTIVLAILASADIALHEIADWLEEQGTIHSHHAMVRAAQQQPAAEVIKNFRKKPRLRCRDARTGRFLKMEKCKENPDTTVIERVEPKR